MKLNLDQKPMFVVYALLLSLTFIFLSGCHKTPANKVIGLMQACDNGNDNACKELNDAL